MLPGETLTRRRSTPTPRCTGTTTLSAHSASPQKVAHWVRLICSNKETSVLTSCVCISSCFVCPGTNLLSGGIESVLVQWKYNQESQRDFLPRLGAAITHVAVSPDGALFCTSHSDNSKKLPPGGPKCATTLLLDWRVWACNHVSEMSV